MSEDDWETLTDNGNIRGVLKRPYDMKEWNKEELLQEIEIQANNYSEAYEYNQKLQKQVHYYRSRYLNLKRKKK